MFLEYVDWGVLKRFASPRVRTRVRVRVGFLGFFGEARVD